MPSIRIKRGTKAQVQSAGASSLLKAGELYLATDEQRVLVGTSASAFAATHKEGESISSGDFNRVQLLDNPPNSTWGISYRYRKFLKNIKTLQSLNKPGILAFNEPSHLSTKNISTYGIKRVYPGTSSGFTSVLLNSATVFASTTTYYGQDVISYGPAMRVFTDSLSGMDLNSIRSQSYIYQGGENVINGGYYVKFTFRPLQAPLAQKMIVGVSTTDTPSGYSSTTQPDQDTNGGIFFGHSTADTMLNVYAQRRNEPASKVKIELPTGYAARAANVTFELALYNPPKANWVRYIARRVDDVNVSVATGVLTDGVPAAGSIMAPWWVFIRQDANSALDGAVEIDFIDFYMEHFLG